MRSRESPGTGGFARTLVLLGAGPLIWTATLILTRLLMSIACTGTNSAALSSGLRLDFWIPIIVTGVAIAVAAWIAFRALARYRARRLLMSSPDRQAIVDFTAAGFAMVWAAAIGWSGTVNAVAGSCT